VWSGFVRATYVIVRRTMTGSKGRLCGRMRQVLVRRELIGGGAGGNKAASDRIPVPALLCFTCGRH
jgi:hypothetical protein